MARTQARTIRRKRKLRRMLRILATLGLIAIPFGLAMAALTVWPKPAAGWAKLVILAAAGIGALAGSAVVGSWRHGCWRVSLDELARSLPKAELLGSTWISPLHWFDSDLRVQGDCEGVPFEITYLLLQGGEFRLVWSLWLPRTPLEHLYVAQARRWELLRRRIRGQEIGSTRDGLWLRGGGGDTEAGTQNKLSYSGDAELLLRELVLERGLDDVDLLDPDEGVQELRATALNPTRKEGQPERMREVLLRLRQLGRLFVAKTPQPEAGGLEIRR